ncbi:MAG: exodeoxyribonuclease III [bacterium]
MSKVTIYSWNVNGIRAVLKKDAFLPFIAEHQPDILCLQETKAQEGQAEIDLPEYTEYWNSAERKGYSGTAIFSKTKAISSKKSLPEDIVDKYELADSYGDSATEGRVIAAEYDKFYVVTVYTPNTKGDLSRVPLRHQHWDPAILEYCQQLENIKPVIYCGDLNVAHTEDDLARPKENKGKNGFTDEERSGFQAFIDAGFIDTFRIFKQGNGLYTWWTNWGGARDRNVGWRIDYILVSPSLKANVIGADIHPDVMGSDHCPVSLTLNI